MYFARIDFNCADEVELFNMVEAEVEVEADDAADSEGAAPLVMVGADNDCPIC